MKNIYPLNPRFALPFVFLLIVSLLFMLPGGSLQAQTPDDTIEYAENGTSPVATFTAMDPEQTAIASWTLAGTDAGVFDIEGGVLTFKESPDYEMAADVGTDNMYSVTVQATDSTMKVGTKTVMVEVTNLDEPGTVTLSALQPQSATAFNATLTDPDTDGTISGTTWQWAKAGSRNGTYGNIEDATSDSYTPDDTDVGSYLRITATYTDGEGSGKSSMARSDNAVQGVRGSNNAPVFPDQNPDTDGIQNESATRMVDENTPAGMAIGNPVAATDTDGDILTYTLEGAGADSFDINRATGQIMTKAALDEETDSSYTVTVRATDPAGVPQATNAVDANSAEITVTITVNDVNEAPAVTGEAEVMFAENDQIGTALDTYTATDPENDTPIVWSVSGADAGKFEISTNGELTFEAQPDYEMPGDANGDNTYEVTVVATDSEGNRETMDVKVMVTNVDEDGTVTLSRTRPRVGVAVRATLGDPDGSISGLTWQWTNGSDDIEDAMSDTYTPTEADATGNVTLNARAMYTDGHGSGKTATGVAANMVAVDTRNSPPAFEDQDTEVDGIQNESATRMVEENAEADSTDDAGTDEAADNVGSPVMAEDPDPNEDPLIYTLSGADAGSFRVRDNGQIEVGAGTELNYETKQTYEVTLTAEDSFGASASIPVTITVTDLDEVPDVTGDDTIEYAENGTSPVATFTAMDPEQTAIASWTLAGTDAGVFDIEGGVLTFKESPDYEMAADVGTDNMYSVTVQATDSTMKVGTKTVMVEVTNLDEPGTVTLSALQPQSATAFNATLTDPDTDGTISGTTWQWAKAGSRNGTYGNIEDATSDSYTPDDTDVGSYLRITATYTDGEGSGKSSMARSDNAVQGVRGSNNAPVFPDQNPDTDGIQNESATRMVDENTPAGMAIGNPVAATDTDGDILTYTLEGAGADSFDINRATGQIMTKAALDEETDSSYTVTVRATDPAGVPQATNAVDANSAEITVTITVNDVNEAPAVTGEAEVMFAENDQIGTALDTYTATDPENDTPIVWSVSGADAGKFEISTNGELTFEAQPDYEMPGDANGDNTYEVTVVATDSEGNRETMDVKVMVTNVDEDGTVTLSRTRPRVGVAVRATLGDPDGSISGLTWQWTNGSDDIEDAMSDTYTPTEADATGNVTLNARAMYTDGHGSGKTATGVAANMVAVDTRNSPPAFEDQDTEVDGIQNESATRMVEENIAALATDDAAADATADNVGSPVMAEDPDPNEDPLIYTLSGADAGSFRVRDNGQIEVGAGTELNYEAKNTYMVTLTAEDSFGESASIPVIIMVTDMDEMPVITVGGLSISGLGNVEYAENGTDPVATYTANGPEAAFARWSLEGADAGDFTISRGGMLTFSSSPDYETPADANTDNTYMVTVKADDGTYMDTHDVAVTVTDVEEMAPVVNEPPVITGDDAVTLGEDGDIGTLMATYTATDPEDDTFGWTLEGADSDKFVIDNNGDLTLLTGLDFEMPGDTDSNNVYEITVVATDSEGNRGTMDVAVTVTNVEEPGTVTLSQTQPRVGVPVTAAVTDLDGSISDLEWQWYNGEINVNALNQNAIAGATSDTYTPTDDDVNLTLRVRVMYTDGEGSGKSAPGVADNPVEMAPNALLERYDANDNDQIDVDELREAITHYISGDIDVDDVREIIRLYILG